MSNNHKGATRQILYEDSLFREAVKETARIEGENLLYENKQLSTEDAGVSFEKQSEFRNRLDSELQNKKNRERRASKIKALQRVAVIILVVSAALTVSLFSVDAFRVKIINLIMEIRTEYTEFQLVDEKAEMKGDRIVDWTNAYVPTYIPEGYLVESSENGDNIKAILFINGDGKIIDYAQYSEAASFNYDTEGATVKDVTVNGNDGKIIVKGYNYSVVWKYEGGIFVVMTQISAEETLKIAENIKFIK
jgi:hypothetical protein